MGGKQTKTEEQTPKQDKHGEQRDTQDKYTEQTLTKETYTKETHKQDVNMQQTQKQDIHRDITEGHMRGYNNIIDGYMIDGYVMGDYVIDLSDNQTPLTSTENITKNVPSTQPPKVNIGQQPQKVDIGSSQQNIISRQQQNIVPPQQQNIRLPQQQNIVPPQQQNIVLRQQQNITLPQQQNITLPQQQNITLPQQQNITLPQHSIDPPLPKVNIGLTQHSIDPPPPKVNIGLTQHSIDPPPPKVNIGLTQHSIDPPPPKVNIGLPQHSIDPPPPKVNIGLTQHSIDPQPPKVNIGLTQHSIDPPPPKVNIGLTQHSIDPPPPKVNISLTQHSIDPQPPKVNIGLTQHSIDPPLPKVNISLTQHSIDPQPPKVNIGLTQHSIDPPPPKVNIGLTQHSIDPPPPKVNIGLTQHSIDPPLPKVNISLTQHSIDPQPPKVNISLPQHSIDPQPPKVNIGLTPSQIKPGPNQLKSCLMDDNIEALLEVDKDINKKLDKGIYKEVIDKQYNTDKHNYKNMEGEERKGDREEISSEVEPKESHVQKQATVNPNKISVQNLNQTDVEDQKQKQTAMNPNKTSVQNLNQTDVENQKQKQTAVNPNKTPLQNLNQTDVEDQKQKQTAVNPNKTPVQNQNQTDVENKKLKRMAVDSIKTSVANLNQTDVENQNRNQTSVQSQIETAVTPNETNVQSQMNVQNSKPTPIYKLNKTSSSSSSLSPCYEDSDEISNDDALKNLVPSPGNEKLGEMKDEGKLQKMQNQNPASKLENNEGESEKMQNKNPASEKLQKIQNQNSASKLEKNLSEGKGSENGNKHTDKQKRKRRKKSKSDCVQDSHNTLPKPTIVYAKIRTPVTNTGLIGYIMHRLNSDHRGLINMKEIIEHETGSIIVEIHCRSKRKADQVTHELHKGNEDTVTKIWCYESLNEAKGQWIRSHKEIETAYNNHQHQISIRAQTVLASHYDKYSEVERELEKINKKTRHITLEDFNERLKLKSALEDKAKELDLQKHEFLDYLKASMEELNSCKQSPKFESSAKVIRHNLAIEYNRLTNGFPIYARRSDILETVKNNQVCVIIGETGSGKSTQMAQYLYQSGLAATGIIACTQPRKIAATSLASHVAKELGTCVGQEVGYRVGMQTRKSSITKIMYMTDHILLNECLQDPNMSAYSCIIIDEAHERSIHTDLLIGMIKKCLKVRQDLRVIITSATISPEIFVQYFHKCPVLQVSGRMFPVEVIWEEPQDGVDSFDNYQEKAVKKAIEIHRSEGEGDILVFVTKPMETEKCCQRFQDMIGNRQNYITLPLHGRLQSEEQQKVFDPPPAGKRKIVFATNSAETSVTIPGIKYVIDTGLVNEMKFDAVRKISTLSVTMVTQSSARQRKGRAGRLGPGKCYRLYTEKDFQKMIPDSVPEILKVHLGHALLKLMELGVDPVNFDFIESPSADAMNEAFTSLHHIGAVKDNQISDLGKWIAKMPFDPQYGAFVYEAVNAGLGLEGIVVSAASGTNSVFYRGGSKEETEEADRQKILFCDEEGDQITTLNVFKEWHKVGEREKGRWCVKNSVNGKSLKAIRETTNEVINTLKKELKVEVKFSFAEKHRVKGTLVSLLLKALSRNLSHFLGHMKAGYNIVSKDQRVEPHPSSSLLALGSQPEWIVFDQVMRTSRDFAMQITPVPENLVLNALQEGWLNINLEEARKKQIKIICQENVGPQLFREFVGPRYMDLRSFEAELTAMDTDTIVVVEGDQEKGELKVLAGESNKSSSLSKSLTNSITPLRNKYKEEESEEKIGSSTDFSERVIIGAGGLIMCILMPGEYKTVMINCTLDQIENLSEEYIRQHFSRHGRVNQCIKFFRKDKSSRIWGKVVYESNEAAMLAVQETREQGPDSTITARPNVRITMNNTVGFSARIQWCRRPSRGFGFVEFANIEDQLRALTRHGMRIAGCPVRLSPAKNSPKGVHVSNFSKLVNEDVLRDSFVEALDIDPIKDIEKVTIVRDKVNLHKDVFESYKTRLKAKLAEFSNPNNFQLQVREPRTERDVNFLAFCLFKHPEEGHNACVSINNGFELGNQAVSIKPDINTSILIYRDIWQLYKDEINTKLKEFESKELRTKIKELRNGNFVIEMRSESVDIVAQSRMSLQEVIKGDLIECENNPKFSVLFSSDGRRTVKEIMKKTETLIMTDQRVMSMSIHGQIRQRTLARNQLEDYVERLAHGRYSDVELLGAGRPPGIMKALMLKYKCHLGDLRTQSGLSSVKLDLRRHRIKLFGTSEAIDKATELIKGVAATLSTDGSRFDDAEGPDCVTCFCPIETKDLFRLEFCGHPYCRECVQMQMDTSLSTKDFPITCAQEDCLGLFIWRDFRNLAKSQLVNIPKLVSASLSAYVSEHKDQLRFCITPDCPAVYRVTESSALFCCPECSNRICSSCHVQYHDGLTCIQFKSYGRDDNSILKWLKEDQGNRKMCPNCGVHIEKIGGCNKVKCGSCKHSICWVCMKYFSSSEECYGHMQREHGSYV